MKKSDMHVYKDRLLALRGRLQGDVNAMAKSALERSADESGVTSAMPIHMAELGSDNFEQEFTLSLVETEEGTLAAIDMAIGRVDEGLYGKCVSCEGVIPKTRLNAVPYALMCIHCAENKESA